MVAAVLHGEKGARLPLGGALGARLAGLDEHAGDAVHDGKALGLDARRAAGDDDLRRGPLAVEAPDRLPRLARRLGGDGASVDDDALAASIPECRRAPRAAAAPN